MKRYALFFLFFLCSTVCAHSEGPTVIGKVMVQDNTPMTTGVVLLYNKSIGPPPHPYKYWRVPDVISGTNNNGEFALDVPEGTYYLMIAQKSPEGEIGPPQNNEFLYFHGDSDGNPYPITITAQKQVNLGTLSNTFIWSPQNIVHDKNITSIEGIVSDTEDKPVQNALVFAYLYKNATGRPAFVSDRTDKNGSFFLRVHDGGTFFLKVRSVIGGGAPEAGEFLNTTKEFESVMANPERGKKLKGVSLKVKKFAGKGSTGEAKPEKVWKKISDIQTQETIKK